MIAGLSPTLQALLATLFTWLVTALGAALVFLVPRSLAERSQRKLLDAALGFAAGVMLAASYWSLLAPALEFAEQSGVYGAHSYAPVTVGLLLGAAFVYAADQLIPHEAGDAVAVLSQTRTRDDGRSKKQDDETEMSGGYGGSFASQAPPLTRAASMSRKRNTSSTRLDEAADEMEAHRMPERQVSASGKKLKSSPPPMLAPGGSKKKGTRSSPRRQSGAFDMGTVAELAEEDQQQESPRENHSAASAAAASAAHEKAQSWHRILLLVVAIVIHNFPVRIHAALRCTRVAASHAHACARVQNNPIRHRRCMSSLALLTH
jgi:zinc transporter 11